jgi:hypothetical protein
MTKSTSTLAPADNNGTEGKGWLHISALINGFTLSDVVISGPTTLLATWHLLNVLLEIMVVAQHRASFF